MSTRLRTQVEYAAPRDKIADEDGEARSTGMARGTCRR